MINHSFAVLAYKDSPYLPACLNSLENQTVKSEIYICTSTPSKYITDIADQFGIEVYVTESQKGIAHDWNFGLQQSKTKYVTLAHQDDLYMPAYAENCFAQSEKYKDILICFTGYAEIAGSNRRPDTAMLKTKKLMLGFFIPFSKGIRSRFWKKFCLSFGSPIPCPTVMYNLDKLNDFKFSNELSISLDWDAWYRMAEMHGRFIYIPEILLNHRIHKDSETTVGLQSNLRQAEDLKMFSRFWPKFIAEVLSKFYANSYKSNETKQE